MKTKQTAVCLVLRIRATHTVPDILLGTKRRGAYRGKVLFPGGKIEPTDLSPEAAACRELAEETGLSAHPKHARLCGRFRIFKGKAVAKPQFIVRFYEMVRYTGQLKKNGEFSDLCWYPLNRIPWQQTLPISPYGLPLLLLSSTVRRIPFLDVRLNRKGTHLLSMSPTPVNKR